MGVRGRSPRGRLVTGDNQEASFVIHVTHYTRMGYERQSEVCRRCRLPSIRANYCAVEPTATVPGDLTVVV
jgi:hypothetical protein